MSSEEDEDDENYAAPDGGEEEYVELDLNKTLTWTGNAVNVQAGGEFRLPLIVPRPSVLAIQFEVEGGYDIEFSLNFKDDHDQSSGVLVEPVRVSDREGQLDIDTTGVCELLWSNSHAWMYSKVLSYQLQLAPKVNTQMRKYRRAVLQAACDFRVVAAAESAEEVDRNLRTLKTRTGKLQDDEKAMQEKAKAAENRRTRYLSHVKKLESEVEAAKAHVAQAEADVAACEREAAEVESRLVAMQGVRSLDAGVTEDMQLTLDDCEEPLTLLFDAYAGSMYAADDDDDEGAAEKKIDRAELIHLLQDFRIMRRSRAPEAMCGVFVGMGQALSLADFKRCLARAALALVSDEQADADADEDEGEAKLRWALLQLPARIERTRLPALDVQRRVRVLAASEHLQGILDPAPPLSPVVGVPVEP